MILSKKTKFNPCLHDISLKAINVISKYKHDICTLIILQDNCLFIINAVVGVVVSLYVVDENFYWVLGIKYQTSNI